VNEVLAREGFGQRKCVLNVSTEALERVIAAGYDPALGTRAMKRAVERELTQPAASRLAELSPDNLTVVTVNASDNILTVDVQAPGWAERVPIGDRASMSVADRIAEAWDALDGIDNIIDSLRPKGSMVSGKVSVEHERYFALKELANAISDTLNEYEDRLEDNKTARLEGRQPDSIGRKARYRAIKPQQIRSHDHDVTQPFQSLSSAVGMEEALRELFDSAEPIPDDADLFDVENKLALLQLMATAQPHEKPVYMWIRGFPEGIECPLVEQMAKYYSQAWNADLGVEVHMYQFDKYEFNWVEVKGIHARLLALREVGTHLFLPKHGGPIPVRVDVVDSLLPQLTDPFAFGPILRIYPERQPVVDVRTGLVSPLPGSADFAEAFRTFTLAALPRATSDGPHPNPSPQGRGA
jgi:hypothetical protein